MHDLFVRVYVPETRIGTLSVGQAVSVSSDSGGAAIAGTVSFVSAQAETNRPPFDLVEAESELVAGFMVEYSSTGYLLFMLGEYVAITLMCAMTSILFLGGWLPIVDIAVLNWVPGVVWFMLKLLFVFFMFAMVKAIVPRYRYDQLMRLGWKVFLPISLFWAPSDGHHDLLQPDRRAGLPGSRDDRTRGALPRGLPEPALALREGQDHAIPGRQPGQRDDDLQDSKPCGHAADRSVVRQCHERDVWVNRT